VHDELLERHGGPLAEQMVGAGGRLVLSAPEPGVLERAGRRETRRRVPVEAARHEVDQLRVVAVVERRAQRPRRRHAAHLAAPRLARRQLAGAARARPAAVPTTSTAN